MHTCANCGDSYTDNETNAFGHSMTHITVAPTCVADGAVTHTCCLCGYSYQDLIKSEGHVWSDWTVTKEADEDIEGSKERVCSTCGETETEVIPAIHYHNFVVHSQTEATCTENGVIYRACSCGETNYSTVEEAFGHSWVHHHEDEVGHYEGKIACHCGWTCPIDCDYITAFAAHVENIDIETRYDHSYFEKTTWVVDTPAKDWYECSTCGETK